MRKASIQMYQLYCTYTQTNVVSALFSSGQISLHLVNAPQQTAYCVPLNASDSASVKTIL